MYVFRWQLRALLDVLRGTAVKTPDKVRLALLYVLRYEGMANIEQLKFELVGGGVPQEKADLVDLIIAHAGKVAKTI